MSQSSFVYRAPSERGWSCISTIAYASRFLAAFLSLPSPMFYYLIHKSKSGRWLAIFRYFSCPWFTVWVLISPSPLPLTISAIFFLILCMFSFYYYFFLLHHFIHGILSSLFRTRFRLAPISSSSLEKFIHCCAKALMPNRNSALFCL